MEKYVEQAFQVGYPELLALFQPHFADRIASIDYGGAGGAPGKPGICGEYAILRLVFSFDTRPEEALTLFVRRQLDSRESKQAHHYRVLGEIGIPTPRFYGAIQDEHEREILFLDHEQEIVDEAAFLSSEANRLDALVHPHPGQGMGPGLEGAARTCDGDSLRVDESLHGTPDCGLGARGQDRRLRDGNRPRGLPTEQPRQAA
jgi:hypothetical protein